MDLSNRRKTITGAKNHIELMTSALSGSRARRSAYSAMSSFAIYSASVDDVAGVPTRLSQYSGSGGRKSFRASVCVSACWRSRSEKLSGDDEKSAVAKKKSSSVKELLPVS